MTAVKTSIDFFIAKFLKTPDGAIPDKSLSLITPDRNTRT